MLQGQPLHLLKYVLQILRDASEKRHQEGECSLRGTHCKGNLVPSRSKLHMKFLKPRRSFGPKGDPRPLLEPYCHQSYGQHHGGCLFKEGGSKSGPLCALLWQILLQEKGSSPTHSHFNHVTEMQSLVDLCYILFFGVTCFASLYSDS